MRQVISFDLDNAITLIDSSSIIGLYSDDLGKIEVIIATFNILYQSIFIEGI